MVLSSHIVAELERVCDHIVILAEGGVRLDGAIDEILASSPADRAAERAVPVAPSHVVDASATPNARRRCWSAPTPSPDSGWRSDDVSLEEIVLAYLGRREPPRPLQPMRAVAS